MVGEQGLLALARSGLVPMLLAPAEARCSWGLLLCDLGLVSRALRAAFLDSDGFLPNGWPRYWQSLGSIR